MEVLNTRPLSQLVTEATVKVCWVDDEKPNRNNTLITEQVGREIAATLPGAPVVGFFKEAENDFQEHSVRITIEDNSVKFESLTRPYGFVAPEKQPWYQKFMEDGIERTYLMCKVYLWTTQYPEAKMALGKGQSMELNPDSVDGYFDGDVFVFTSATLDRLCILGDAFEPCFEGAKIATSFSRLYTDFAQEVQKIIGGRYSIMDGKLAVEEVAENVVEDVVEVATEEVAEESAVSETESAEAEVAEPETTESVEFTAEEQEAVETEEVETEEVVTEEVQEEPAQEFTAQEEVEESSSEAAEEATSTDNSEFTVQLDTLNKRIQELEEQLNVYKQKEAAEQEAKKTEMLDKYRKVLTAEEISPIEEQVATYSLDDLEAKLSIAYARRALVETEQEVSVQFTITDTVAEENDLPDFMQRASEIDQAKLNF